MTKSMMRMRDWTNPSCRRGRAVGVVALLAAALATPASGQDLEAACRALGGSSIGAWTEHSIASAQGEFAVRFALVNHRAGTWYEVKSETHAGTSIVQFRVPGFPFTPAQIEEVVMQTGTGTPMRVPDALVEQYKAANQAGPLADIQKHCRTAEVIGHEDVAVRAGSFSTTHLRFPSSGGDVWVSDRVPFGIVRGTIPEQGTLELTAFGSDAVSSITASLPAEPATPPGGAR